MADRQVGFWDVEHRLRQLSERGGPLEKLAGTVDFEIFRAALVAAHGRRDRSKGGQPPFDPVRKFRMLVLQAMHGLSLAQTEVLVADRLSWRRCSPVSTGRSPRRDICRCRARSSTPRWWPRPASATATRALVEHPFAHQKGAMGLAIRTIGLARATATVTLANMAYNMRRWCWLEGRSLPA